MKYTTFPMGLWTDDKFLTHSPEQKQLALYFWTCPERNLSGVIKMGFKHSANCLGFTLDSFTSAFTALLETFPTCYAYDKQTNEFALIDYPRWMLANIKGRALNILQQDIAKIESPEILKLILKHNPTSLTAEYLAQFRRLNIALQREKLHPEAPENGFSIGGAQIADNQLIEPLNVNVNVNYINIGGETPDQQPVFEIQPKGKKRKENKAILPPPVPGLDEVRDYAIELLKKKREEINKKAKQPEFIDIECWAADFASRFVSHYEAREWKQSNGRALVSWKAAVSGTWSDTLYSLIFTGKAYRAYGVQQQKLIPTPQIVAPNYQRRV